MDLLSRVDLTEYWPAQKATVTLAGAGVFAALAALLTLAKASVPFPLMPYLQIDFSEIPILVAFFLFGPVAATISAVIQWMFLNVQGSDAPLGPAIKFIAIMSTLGGFWFGNILYQRFRRGAARPPVALSLILSNAIVWRIVAMTVVNYVVLLYIAPVFFGADYLGFARGALNGLPLGLHLTSITDVLVYTLLFTALYNLVNLMIAAVPAELIVSPITATFKHITSVDAWLARSLKS
jgi:riboflavin transporter FmnP